MLHSDPFPHVYGDDGDTVAGNVLSPGAEFEADRRTDLLGSVKPRKNLFHPHHAKLLPAPSRFQRSIKRHAVTSALKVLRPAGELARSRYR